METMTGEQIRQAIRATIESLKTKGLTDDVDFEVAVKHNVRCKYRMIHSLNQLYAYINGTGKLPTIKASEAFNPSAGEDKTNIYYMFKELKKGMPWEIRRDLLILPTALTFLMLDMANNMFHGKAAYRMQLNWQAFLNLWSLPKDRPELTEEEKKAKRTDYMHKIAYFENRLLEDYQALSEYFKEIEDPEHNQVTKKIDEINKRTKKIAAKVCGREKQPSAYAHKYSYDTWIKYRSDPNVCKSNSKVSYADVFDYCRKGLEEHGIFDAISYKKAVQAHQKLQKRKASKA